MSKISLKVDGLDAASAGRFEAVCIGIEGVESVETWPNEAELTFRKEGAATREHVISTLKAAGFAVASSDSKTAVIGIEGMHCRSCEITVERKFKTLPGVEKVNVDLALGRATIELSGPVPSLAAFGQTIADDGYTVRKIGGVTGSSVAKAKPLDVIGSISVVLLIAYLSSRFGWLDSVGSTTAVAGFWAAIVLGLVAGSSSCLAVSGGLMLTMAAKYREFAPNAGMRPVYAFITGRVVAYSVLGGLIGIIGSTLTPTPLFTATITLLAALVMLVMGLDMLGIAPSWLKSVLPRLPKKWGHAVADAGEKGAAPFLLGGATFFIPCGFTQALQIYALTAGPGTAAIILGGFALGTAPALLALGYAAGSLKGRPGELFIRFSGALVLFLGIWNFQNGLTAAGFVIPTFGTGVATDIAAEDANVRLVDGVQVISIKLTQREPYYAPTNRFTVKRGVPVRLEINGIGAGCRTQFQIPRFGISVPLNKPQTVVEFTPVKLGAAAFSCSMGMYSGTITVI